MSASITTPPTTTTTGLRVQSAIDPNTYPKGIKVTNAEMASINSQGDGFHREWNHIIAPRPET